MPTTSNHRAVFRRFRSNAEKATLAVASDVAAQMAESLVVKTPVDTTRAEANWIAALNTIPQDFDETRRNSGGTRLNLSKAIELTKRMKLGDVFVMANSTPYIFFLEHGSSQQAPAGFRDLTAAMFHRMVERAAKRRLQS